jgi:hypothetical protein
LRSRSDIKGEIAFSILVYKKHKISVKLMVSLYFAASPGDLSLALGIEVLQ